MPVITDTMAVSMAAPLPPVHRVDKDHVFGRKLIVESCRRSCDVNFHLWLWAASSTNVRCRGISCRSDHFGVVEVPDTQKDRDLETYGRTIDLKCDTNLLILLASRIYLDACHCDLKFAHPVTRISRETSIDPKRRDPTSPVRLTSKSRAS